jgi:hypothetical protein
MRTVVLLTLVFAACQPGEVDAPAPRDLVMRAFCQHAYDCGYVFPDEDADQRHMHKIDCIEEWESAYDELAATGSPLVQQACLDAVNGGEMACDVYHGPWAELPEVCR